jgi:hypothetical protein
MYTVPYSRAGWVPSSTTSLRETQSLVVSLDTNTRLLVELVRYAGKDVVVIDAVLQKFHAGSARWRTEILVQRQDIQLVEVERL